ncbi:hypothetical protein F53441_80 [Fusarium austroafricanum]|uniref:Copper-fist domain-containing protein n=1 Tax=Fusarium austroafricanum TaxID=2364996 RepID=A0A8H4P3V0_9HYPO|nr:hypothetical protein F53441_80 [Fusarium austroafricanum]
MAQWDKDGNQVACRKCRKNHRPSTCKKEHTDDLQILPRGRKLTSTVGQSSGNARNPGAVPASSQPQISGQLAVGQAVTAPQASQATSYAPLDRVSGYAQVSGQLSMGQAMPGPRVAGNFLLNTSSSHASGPPAYGMAPRQRLLNSPARHPLAQSHTPGSTVTSLVGNNFVAPTQSAFAQRAAVRRAAVRRAFARRAHAQAGNIQTGHVQTAPVHAASVQTASNQSRPGSQRYAADLAEYIASIPDWSFLDEDEQFRRIVERLGNSWAAYFPRPRR